MGMDCYPKNPAIKPKSANWRGWEMLRSILLELGQDTSTMAGLNDGDAVPAHTAKQWGEAILSAIPKLRNVWITDPNVCGGGEYLVSLLIGTDPLTPNNRKWLSDWAHFFINSEGFEQW